MAERSFTTFTKPVPTRYPLAFEEVKLVDPTTVDGLIKKHDLKSLTQSPESLLGEVFRLRERVHIICFGGGTLVKLEYYTRIEQIADVRQAIKASVFKSKSSLRRFIQELPDKVGRFTIKDNKGVNIIKVTVEPNPNFIPPADIPNAQQLNELEVGPKIQTPEEDQIPVPTEIGEPALDSVQSEEVEIPDQLEAEVDSLSADSEPVQEGDISLIELPESIDDLIELISSASKPTRCKLESDLSVEIESFDMNARGSEVAVGGGVLTSGNLPALVYKNGSIIIFKKRSGPAVILRRIEDESDLKNENLAPPEDPVSTKGQSEKLKVIQAGDLPAGIDDLLSFVEAEAGPIHLEYEPGKVAKLTLFDMGDRDSEFVVAYAGLQNGIVWKRLNSNNDVIVFKRKNGPAVLFQPIAANDNEDSELAS